MLDRGRFGCLRSVRVEILDNGHFLLSPVDIQQPLMLISGNNNERKMLANCISPFRRLLADAFVGNVVPGASSLRYVVVPPLSP